MKLNVQSIHFDADQKLIDFIQRKVDKLETFYDEILGGDVFLKLGKGEHARENKIVEIKLFVPGENLFAKDQSTTFEAATDQVVEALRSQLLKFKEKGVKQK